jgi:dTDP-glucose pyrophosphorylase
MKNWKKTLIGPATKIRKVIETIDNSDAQIALVVDECQRLLGTVTDGDVRRGILKGVSMDEPAERVMNSRPVTVRHGESAEIVLEAMKNHSIHQVPLVDKKKTVLGLEILDELLRSKEKENWVLLMVGGYGMRLRPLTEKQPKPLISIGNQPILETILKNFSDAGFKKFFFSVHYRDEMIREHFGDGSRWGVSIQYLKEETKLGTAGALNLLPSKPTRPLIVMNGDLLTKVNFSQLLNFHSENGSDATMCVREYDFQVPFGVVNMSKHHITGIDEKPVHKFYVNAGIYILEPSALKLVPKKGAFDMPLLFEKLIALKRAVTAFPIHEYWLDIGQIEDLKRAHGEYSKVFEAPRP